MSLAENLLNSLAETTTQSASPINDILMIDAESRTINVPATETLFGVVTDGNVERKYFKCPRIVGDNIDLTTLGLRIYYRNALGEDDGYIVTDVKVSGEYITFSWKLEDKLFKSDGSIYFAICAVKVDGNGVETCAWNTTLASGDVLDGFRVRLTGSEETEARDVLQQLLNLLQTRSNEAVNAVTNEGAEQITNVEAAGVEQRILIESKGAETLATIPEDYTSTYTAADNALRKKASAILLEEEGTVISVNDASDDYVRGLKVFGKSEQITTNGYQLFDTSRIHSLSAVGATLTNNGNGSFTISGSGELTGVFATSVEILHDELATLLKAGMIYFDVSSVEPYIYLQLIVDDSPVFTLGYGNSSAEVLQEHLDNETSFMRMGFYGVAGTTISPGTIKPMLYQDGDGTWEPFTGGKPSPSPEYPQDIVSVGDDENVVVGLYGSNIINPKTLLVSTNTSLEVSDDGYTTKAVGGTASGWCSSIYSLPTTMVKLLRGKTLYSSCDSFTTDRSDANVRAGFNVKLDDGTSIYPASISPNHTTDTKTIPANAVGMTFGVYTNNTGSALETDNTVVIKGLRVSVSEHTDWEECKELQTITIPRSLPGIPVTSGGNYTDSDGQQWICDEVDFERGVYVKRVSENVITSDTHVTLKTDRADCNQFAFELLKYDNTVFISRSVPGLCNKFKRGLYTADCFDIGTVADSGWGGKSRVTFYADKSITTIEAFMEYIGDDCVVLSPLPTPIETPLTADELNAFRALHTNYPNTVVLNDSGAKIRLLYNADSKSYIEKNYVSKAEYNDLVGRITALENK